MLVNLVPDIRYFIDDTDMNMNTERYYTCNGREWRHPWDIKMKVLPKFVNGYMKRNNGDRKINANHARPSLLRWDSEGSCDSLSPPFDERNERNLEIGLNSIPKFTQIGLNSTRLQSTKSCPTLEVPPFMAVVGLYHGKSTFPPPFGSFCGRFCPKKPLVETPERSFGTIPTPFPCKNGPIKMPEKLVKELFDSTVNLEEPEPRKECIDTKKSMVEDIEEKKPRTYASVVASGPKKQTKVLNRPQGPGPVQMKGPNGGKLRNSAQQNERNQHWMEKCAVKDMARNNKDKGNNVGNWQHCKSSRKRQKTNPVLLKKCQGGNLEGETNGETKVPDAPETRCLKDKSSSRGNAKRKSDKVQTAAAKEEEVVVGRVEENGRRSCLNSTIASILGWVTNLSEADEESKSENEEWDNDSCDELDSLCSDLWAHFKNNNRWELSTTTPKNGDTSPSVANALAEVNRKWSEGMGTTIATKQSPQKKNVHFAEPEKLFRVHPMIAWSFAYQSARKGPWEDMKRDRERFQQRIDNIQVEIASVLQPEHRKRVYAERFSDTCD